MWPLSQNSLNTASLSHLSLNLDPEFRLTECKQLRMGGGRSTGIHKGFPVLEELWHNSCHYSVSTMDVNTDQFCWEDPLTLSSGRRQQTVHSMYTIGLPVLSLHCCLLSHMSGFYLLIFWPPFLAQKLFYPLPPFSLPSLT